MSGFFNRINNHYQLNKQTFFLYPNISCIHITLSPKL